MNYTISTKRI